MVANIWWSVITLHLISGHRTPPVIPDSWDAEKTKVQFNRFTARLNWVRCGCLTKSILSLSLSGFTTTSIVESVSRPLPDTPVLTTTWRITGQREEAAVSISSDKRQVCIICTFLKTRSEFMASTRASCISRNAINEAIATSGFPHSCRGDVLLLNLWLPLILQFPPAVFLSPLSLSWECEVGGCEMWKSKIISQKQIWTVRTWMSWS